MPFPTCWMEIENYPRCYFWNDQLKSESAVVTWTGECSDRQANGFGTLKFRTYTDTGQLQNGKKNGDWSLRWPNGRVEEGPYVDGKKNGRWTWRHADGSDGIPSCYDNGKFEACPYR